MTNPLSPPCHARKHIGGQMWIINEDGFFSVVRGADTVSGISEEKMSGYFADHNRPRDEYFVVRSRDSASLEAMLERIARHAIVPDNELWTGKIWSGEGSDYEHRVLVPKAMFQTYMKEAIGGIDYQNFKHHVGAKNLERLSAFRGGKINMALKHIWTAIAFYWPRDEENDPFAAVS